MKKHRLLKILSAMFIVTIVIIGGVFAYTYVKTQNIVNESYKAANNKELRNPDEQISNKKPISILLLGTDTGAFNRTDRGRTDTMIVATINPKLQKTVLVSIPRDTRTTISGFENVGPTKINSAYTYGAAGAAMDTVQNLIGSPIDYYVLINMGGLEKVIDEVGGIDVVSPLSFNFAGYEFKKGESYHMDGKKALEFSRMRHEDPKGDYGRQERQRLVIISLMNELKKPTNLTNTDLIKEIGKNIQTDFKFSQFKNLGLNYRTGVKEVVSDHIQGNGKMISGQSFEVVSNDELNRIKEEIANNLK